jgi:two-component sensor histidine kinase
MPRHPRDGSRDAAGILHDIAAPLMAARGWAEMLCQGRLASGPAKWASRLNDCLAEIAGLLARTAPRERFAPMEDLERLAQALEARARETGTRFLCSRRGGGPWCVSASREAFRRIATNLLGNALRHAPGGCVEAEVLMRRAAGGWRLRLEVSDEGPGLGSRRASTLFRKGGRGAESPGQGLGLHLVRELAKANGGEAGARDEPTGARFWAEIVAEAEPGAEPRPRNGNPVVLVGGPARQRQWLARLLTGWSIACAEVPEGGSVKTATAVRRVLGGEGIVLAETLGKHPSDIRNWVDLAAARPCGPLGLMRILDGNGHRVRLAKSRGLPSMGALDAQDQGQAPA